MRINSTNLNTGVWGCWFDFVSFDLTPKFVLFKDNKRTHLIVAHSSALQSGTPGKVEGKLLKGTF